MMTLIKLILHEGSHIAHIWQAGQPIYRAMNTKEYKEWQKTGIIPARISFANTRKYAEEFDFQDQLMILQITPADKKFEASFRRILDYNKKHENFFFDYPFEVMFDIELNLNNVKPKIIREPK
jgi:hypothetical protein